ncbi:DUF423 domain-containing protein [Calothrix sp. PCC 6303]|uniref:DUF423 domain-containing protein n=1 Tax=Calothrix sp. PCC 6303 TaxID=1170562 RepID=UPI0002A01803|nr:DUF423 domain-containing protein [Calothrix sp. PCC 6303]AFY99535.1 protein of unknown function DUF423 [Calothrix sp. PCC 6303]
MFQIFLSVASVFAGSAVMAGAFASHALRSQISQRSLEVFEVGTRYQMYHALALLVVALLISQNPSPPLLLVISGWLFIAGILIFSGSLYALSLTDIKILGAITPIGGVAFIAGWIILAIASFQIKA